MEDLFGKMQELMSDPESMKQLNELAQMFKQESTGSDPSAAHSDEGSAGQRTEGFPFDPAMLMQLGELLNASGAPDPNTGLLLALRPHLRQERQEKVDRAVKMLRLLTVWNLMKDNGMLQNFLS